MNTCRTCTHGGKCSAIDVFPNATVAEYGSYGMFETDRVHKIMAELYARGPVAAGTVVLRFGERGGCVQPAGSSILFDLSM